MMAFDDPTISKDKTNEQNIEVIKSYLTELVGQLLYQINSLESRIEKLEKEIDDGK